MRYCKLLLLILFLSFVGLDDLTAQKIINDATISYSISTESTDKTAAMAKSLEGATLTIYIKGSQSRTDMLSALGIESNLYDSKTGKGTILKQYSGQKLLITLTRANRDQKNKYFLGIKFQIENSEQLIAGLKCKKAIGEAVDGSTVIVYFAPEIMISNKSYDNAFPQLPGLPVQYELQSGNLKFKYVLSNVNYDPVLSAIFEIPKTGFRTMTYEETQQLKKG